MSYQLINNFDIVYWMIIHFSFFHLLLLFSSSWVRSLHRQRTVGEQDVHHLLVSPESRELQRPRSCDAVALLIRLVRVPKLPWLLRVPAATKPSACASLCPRLLLWSVEQGWSLSYPQVDSNRLPGMLATYPQVE